MAQLNLFADLALPRPRAPAITAAPPRTVGVRAGGFPLLFLDFDGVISWDVSEERKSAISRLRPDRVAVLNTIVARTGCLIVVSSMWRFDPRDGGGFKVPRLQELLNAAGFIGEVVGITKHLPGVDVRGKEIQAWIDEMEVEPGTPIAILDDWQPMGHLDHRYVQTDYHAGLTVAKAERVIKLLGER